MIQQMFPSDGYAKFTFPGESGIARMREHFIEIDRSTLQCEKPRRDYRLHISRIMAGLRPDRTD